ncbi:MAG: putative O-glycosylation ligase, exosortase A system-associated [Candidatus Accumulibacter sp.]|uniref:O-glycosylation ligase, exosortase A system-associated n=1 Tax=Candidatus Accumulibacter proximus TaxID=2954385 RepID=A0A935UGI0_9PROT|nr:putative O-glycosylation ligase, exosortase A system-associated [Candidatus Accumulibacter proximus]
MRDVLLVSIVIAMALMALKRPWVGVVLWVWLSLMNPHRYAYGFASNAPLAAIAVAATITGLLVTKERQSPFRSLPAGILAAFALWMTISWLMGIDPAGDYLQWSKVMKIYFMTFVALALLKTKHQIMAFAWVVAGSLAILGAKGGLFTILNGGNYRVWGPPGSFIEDNNEFALALIATIPLVHFLQLQCSRTWLKHLLSIVIILCAASALGSHSRGGMLAIACMGAVFWWRSSRKGLATLMILVMAVGVLPMMPEAWWNRMDTIATYEEDGSAMGRITAWRVALEVAKHYFFGGGMYYQHQFLFLTYAGSANALAAHSIYFQVLGNHGFVGLLIYLALCFTTYRCAGWLRTNAGNIPEAKWAAQLGGMIQVSLAGYAVGGAFLSLAYFDLPYYLMVVAVSTRQWVEKRAWEHELPMTFLQYAGLRRQRAPTTVDVVSPGESRYQDAS